MSDGHSGWSNVKSSSTGKSKLGDASIWCALELLMCNMGAQAFGEECSASELNCSVVLNPAQ